MIQTTEIIYNTKVSNSNLWDYKDDFILVRRNITIVGDNGAQVAFKNYAPFITKIDGNQQMIVKAYIWLCQCMICYNTVQIIMTQHIAYGFILKLKQTGFNNAIENTAKFKSLKYKAKSLRPTVPQSI